MSTPGFGTGGVVKQIGQQLKAAHDQASANAGFGSLLQQLIGLTQRLADRLAPPQLNYPIAYNLPVFQVGNGVGTANGIQTISLGAGKYSSIIGTCTGNSAQINVYFGSVTDPTNQPPDLVFVSGSSSSILHFPAQAIGQVTIVSVGSNPALGTLKFQSY